MDDRGSFEQPADGAQPTGRNAPVWVRVALFGPFAVFVVWVLAVSFDLPCAPLWWAAIGSATLGFGSILVAYLYRFAVASRFMERPRLTVRTMMALVAILAIGMSLWGTFVRARRFQVEANRHAAEERHWEAAVMQCEDGLAKMDKEWPVDSFMPQSVEAVNLDRVRKQMLERIEFCRQGLARERKLKLNYERAVRRPLLPVASDPPALPPRP